MLDIVKKAVSKKMIYSTQQDRFWDFMSIECRNNRTDAIAMEAMSKEFSGVARTPGDAASQRHVKLCERNIARSGQAAARKVAEMGPLPIGNDRDGYRPAGRAQTAKEIIRSRRKGTEAWRSCNMCEKTEAALGKKLSACASCGRAWYCSRECQKSHWKSHKTVCKNIVRNIGSQKNAAD